jgi:lantibiotic modifying enzyme
VLRHVDDAAGARLPSSPLEYCRRRLSRLSESDLRQQLTLVRSAFLANIAEEPLSRVSHGTATVDELTRLANRIASDLVATARHDRDRALPLTWVAPLAATTTRRPWPPGVLGYDLFTGRTGIALALAAAGRVLDRSDCRGVAAGVFQPCSDLLDDGALDVAVTRIGTSAYTGTAGLLWAMFQAGGLLDQSRWQASATRHARRLLATMDPGPPGDVISGQSGVFAALAAPLVDDPAWAAFGEGGLTTLMTLPAGSTVLQHSGFAHGLAGPLWYASRLAGEQCLDLVGPWLLDRLAEFFDPGSDNWKTGPSARFSHGWCHGRAGITAALAGVHRRRPQWVSAERLTQLAEAVLDDGFGRNLTHCHGDLGNWDLLRVVDGAIGSDYAERATATLSVQRIVDGLDNPASRYATSNALMVGSSGVLLHLVQRLSGLRLMPTMLDQGDLL